LVNIVDPNLLNLSFRKVVYSGSLPLDAFATTLRSNTQDGHGMGAASHNIVDLEAEGDPNTLRFDVLRQRR
jgi:hypothetical protein